MVWKNYIWDFDGTLFDTYPVMLEALRQAMLDCKVSYKGDLERYVKQYSIRQFADEYGNQAFLDHYHALEHALQKSPRLYPEIPLLLEKGERHFVLSHRDDSTFELLGDLADKFSEIITSEKPFPRKPDPAAINYLVEKYALNRTETVMIGDRPLDIEAGKNAGVGTLLFDEKNYFGNIADKKIENWSEYL